jgi:hypothetical protein
MNESLVANKWYPHYKGPGRSYTILYPTPQSVLRQAVGAVEYKFLSETVTTEHIRAAVIMPLGVPFEHLLDEPWAMSYRGEDWRMLIVSTVDPLRWIELARASGAIAWLKSHTQTFTYNWEPPERDETGNKVRPPNALAFTEIVDGKKRYKKRYCLDEVLSDLRCGRFSTIEIGVRHNITAATVQNIAKRAQIPLQLGRKKDHRVTT